MTIKDCPVCGGTHYGSYRCPYIKAPCVVCGDETILACSDCAVNSGGKVSVHVCNKKECRLEHDKQHPPKAAMTDQPERVSEALKRTASLLEALEIAETMVDERGRVSISIGLLNEAIAEIEQLNRRAVAAPDVVEALRTALDLIAAEPPGGETTMRRIARAALASPPAEAREKDDDVEICETCDKKLVPGDLGHRCADGPVLCETCAPTWAEVLGQYNESDDGDFGAFVEKTPEETAEDRAAAQAHVDAGDGDKKHVWPL